MIILLIILLTTLMGAILINYISGPISRFLKKQKNKNKSNPDLIKSSMEDALCCFGILYITVIVVETILFIKKNKRFPSGMNDLRVFLDSYENLKKVLEEDFLKTPEQKKKAEEEHERHEAGYNSKMDKNLNSLDREFKKARDDFKNQRK